MFRLIDLPHGRRILHHTGHPNAIHYEAGIAFLTHEIKMMMAALQG
jgi:hypothetical protein